VEKEQRQLFHFEQLLASGSIQSDDLDPEEGRS